MTTKPKEIRSLGDYQRNLSRFESTNDGLILPDLQVVVRLDARRHSPKWDLYPEIDYPFGPVVTKGLFGTCRELFVSGIRISFGFVHGDEVSVLLCPTETATQRKRSRLLSLLASAGAIAFYRETNLPVMFHGRVSELPSPEHVVDYFIWQRKVAARNLFYRSVSRILAAQGSTPQEIEGKIAKLSDEDRTRFSAELGISPKNFSSYERFGAAFWWTGPPESERTIIHYTTELPEDDLRYVDFIRERMEAPTFLPENPGQEIPLREFDKARSKLGKQKGTNHKPIRRKEVTPILATRTRKEQLF